jgi:lipopolysaccharide transport system permease protein
VTLPSPPLSSSLNNGAKRNIKYASSFLIQLWLFVTPVIYPTTLVPEHSQALLAPNPLVGIVNGFRACVVGRQPPNPTLTAVSLMMSVVFVLWTGVLLDKERAFADII